MSRVVHLQAHTFGYPYTICGLKGYPENETTWNPEEVDCPDCKEAAAVTLVVTQMEKSNS